LSAQKLISFEKARQAKGSDRETAPIKDGRMGQAQRLSPQKSIDHNHSIAQVVSFSDKAQNSANVGARPPAHAGPPSVLTGI
jgi:hypothetical protein